MSSRFNAKQLGLIVASFIAAFVIDWIAWWLIMGHPTDINAIFHILVTICLASAFILIGDGITKAEIFQ